MAGAHAVQIGTQNFAEPSSAIRVRDELRALMAQLGIARIADAIDVIEPHPAQPEYLQESPWM